MGTMLHDPSPLVSATFIKAILLLPMLTGTVIINHYLSHSLKEYLALKLNIKVAKPHYFLISFLIIVFFERHC